MGPAVKSGQVGASASRVRVQMFPLLAQRRMLQTFCDRWFNDELPPSVAIFRPAMPVVFCTVLSYDEMGDDMRWKTGSFAQNELYFMLLLDRYRERRGRLDFVEHSISTPYIFVDNSMSAVAGRERFGFPKQLGEFQLADRVPWPTSPQPYITLSTWEPTVAGHRLAPLVEIVRDPVSAVGDEDIPYGPSIRERESLFSTRTFATFATTFINEAFVRLFDPGPLQEAPGSLAEIAMSLRDGPGMSAYNLRQFLDPLLARGADYRDLVRFRMRVDGVPIIRRFNEDISLLVHKTEVCPLVERLGLHVSQRVRAPGQRTIDVLRVLSPLYAQVDVTLADTRIVCARSRDQGWKDEAGELITPQPRVEPLLYNEYLGPSSAVFLQDQGEPPILDVKCLLLEASVEKVEALLAQSIPPESSLALRPIRAGQCTALRVLVSRARPRALGEQEELVWLDGSYVSLSVPVEIELYGKTRRAFVVLHDFTDNHFMLQAKRALTGGTTEDASIQATGDWFTSAEDVVHMLSVDAMTLERSAEAVRSEVRRLLDVFMAAKPAPSTAKEGAALASELEGMMTNAGLLLFVGGIPSPSQPGVFLSRRVTLMSMEEELIQAPDQAPAPHDYLVRLHDSETFPLVRSLGLATVDAAVLGARTDAIPGRSSVLQAVAFADSISKNRVGWMEILWQSLEGAEPLRGPR